MKRYNPKDIEPMWQKTWAEQELYRAVDFSDKPKYVMLTEFPYPSGAGMHVGHIREYTLGDVLARHKRQQGYNVLFPMGYDAFGLPTENFAIKNKISPQKATEQNVATFQAQLESVGFSFDWSRSFKTSDPEYYKWTQWLFLKFFEKGLAYQAEIAINWCPHCKTGLANEEVVNGRHERCDTVVEKKLLKQWLLKITEYADRLIDGLKTVDYPSRIADQQINWIGRSRGAEIEFAVEGSDESIKVFTTRPDTIFGATFMVLAPEHPLVEQITTAEQKEHVNSYRHAAAAKTDLERQDTGREKTGVATGAHAINPANGERIPIWIADYVLTGYGTGAIMAVPAHDERDHDFASKHHLPIVQVVMQNFNGHDPQATDRPTVNVIARDQQNEKYCVLRWKSNPGFHGKSGLELPGGGVASGESMNAAAVREFAEETGYVDVTVEAVLPTKYSLYFTYQREGETVSRHSIKSIVVATVNSNKQEDQPNKEQYENDATPIWLTKEELLASTELYELDRAVLLDYFESGAVSFQGDGILVNSGPYDNLTTSEAREKIIEDLTARGVATEKINYRLRDWIFSRQHYWGEPIPIIHCDEHGAVPVPAQDLPVVLPPVEHYEPTDTGESPLAAIADWVNTTCPVCGGPAKRETDTMPNWAGSSWYYLRYFDAHNDQAFAAKDKLDYWQNVDMYLGGMEHTTLHLLYSRFWHEFFYDQDMVPTPEPYQARRGQGIILAADGTKMSKSKGNVVNPTDIIESGYGADAMRLAIAFLAPYDQTTPWSPEGVTGMHRFLSRVWKLVYEYLDSKEEKQDDAVTKQLRQATHRTIKKVSEDLDNMAFNTAIAAMMELTNDLYKLKAEHGFASRDAWQECLSQFIQLLAPYAPHIAEELWHELGHEDSIHTAPWPAYDEKYLVSDTVTIAVQVNGKLRGTVEMPTDVTEGAAIEAARKDSNVAAHLEGKTVSRAIYVPHKLVNLVIKG